MITNFCRSFLLEEDLHCLVNLNHEEQSTRHKILHNQHHLHYFPLHLLWIHPSMPRGRIECQLQSSFGLLILAPVLFLWTRVHRLIQMMRVLFMSDIMKTSVWQDLTRRLFNLLFKRLRKQNTMFSCRTTLIRWKWVNKLVVKPHVNPRGKQRKELKIFAWKQFTPEIPFIKRW